MKKLLFIAEYYPPIIYGGAEISLMTLVELLAKKRYSSTILTPNYQSFSNKVEIKKNIKIIKYQTRRYYLYRNKEKISYKLRSKSKTIHKSLINGYKRYSSYELRQHITKLLKNTRYDIIQANNMESIIALAGLGKSHLKNVKTIGFLRDFQLLQSANKKKTKELLSRFDSLISISHFVKKKYETLGLKNIVNLYNPISSEMKSSLSKSAARKKIGITPKERLILFVGTLVEKKGVELLMGVARDLPKYKFIIAGEGALENKLKKEKPKNVIMPGFIVQDDLKNYYKAADILIVPSLWEEPFGRVIIEAVINGCYVVGSNKGAIPEVIKWLDCGVSVEPLKKHFIRELSKKTQTVKMKPYENEYINSYLKIIDW